MTCRPETGAARWSIAVRRSGGRERRHRGEAGRTRQSAEHCGHRPLPPWQAGFLSAHATGFGGGDGGLRRRRAVANGQRELHTDLRRGKTARREIAQRLPVAADQNGGHTSRNRPAERREGILLMVCGWTGPKAGGGEIGEGVDAGLQVFARQPGVERIDLAGDAVFGVRDARRARASTLLERGRRGTL